MEANGTNPNAQLASHARELGLPKKRLLVLAPQNDPFNVGTESQVKQAAWFASVYQAVGYHGIHLRRLHYRAYDAGLETVNGLLAIPKNRRAMARPPECKSLCSLPRVRNPQDFTDNRAPAPVLSVNGLPYTPEPEYEVEPLSGILNWY